MLFSIKKKLTDPTLPQKQTPVSLNEQSRYFQSSVENMILPGLHASLYDTTLSSSIEVTLTSSIKFISSETNGLKVEGEYKDEYTQLFPHKYS